LLGTLECVGQRFGLLAQFAHGLGRGFLRRVFELSLKLAHLLGRAGLLEILGQVLKFLAHPAWCRGRALLHAGELTRERFGLGRGLGLGACHRLHFARRRLLPLIGPLLGLRQCLAHLLLAARRGTGALERIVEPLGELTVQGLLHRPLRLLERLRGLLPLLSGIGLRRGLRWLGRLAGRGRGLLRARRLLRLCLRLCLSLRLALALRLTLRLALSLALLLLLCLLRLALLRRLLALLLLLGGLRFALLWLLGRLFALLLLRGLGLASLWLTLLGLALLRLLLSRLRLALLRLLGRLLALLGLGVLGLALLGLALLGCLCERLFGLLHRLCRLVECLLSGVGLVLPLHHRVLLRLLGKLLGLLAEGVLLLGEELVGLALGHRLVQLVLRLGKLTRLVECLLERLFLAGIGLVGSLSELVAHLAQSLLRLPLGLDRRLSLGLLEVAFGLLHGVGRLALLGFASGIL